MQTDGQPQTPDAPTAPRASDASRPVRPFARRRGSVIVLAVGVLAVLAIIAISYTVAVRNDRQGAQVVQAASVVAGQEKAVAGEIQAILTADLFGGKIVTRDIPKYLNPSGAPAAPLASGAFRIWPTMFEDGEFSDFPWVDGAPATHSFLKSFPGQTLLGNPGAILIPNTPLAVAGMRDDPWLASSEPIAGPNSTNGRWDTWPQITNLRCGYRLIPNPSNPSVKVWLRDDGRYADLGQFFLSDRALNTRKPDPDAYLSDFEDAVPNNVYPPMVSGPALGRNQQVFDFQISAMGNNPALGGLPAERYAGGTNPNPGRAFPFEPIDERFWADTDGDLRPDARWQVLDAFGGLGGLRWVVACRIIDSSGQINVNTAIESGLNNMGVFAGFNPALPTAQSGEPTITIASLLGGMTPADVDLYRLIRTADRSDRDMVSAGAWFNGAMQGSRNLVRVNRFDPFQGVPVRPAWRVFVDDGLRLTDLLNEQRLALNPSGQVHYLPILGQPQSITGMWRYLAAERDALYREFGAAPSDNESFTTPYSLGDEIDLKTYWGVNNDESLSVLERSLDSGYLPAQASVYSPGLFINGAPVINVGPLRAASPSKYERTLQPTIDPSGSLARARPSVDDLRDDIRHHLTTYSGAADFSPVPVLNEAIEGAGPATRRVFGDRAFNQKIRFRDFPANTLGAGPQERQLQEARKFEMIRRSFGAFSWALAPLATGSSAWDRPIMPPLTFGDVGVGATDSVKHYGGGLGGPATKIGTDTGLNMGAAYAILRAASLAVNLADAQDAEPIAVAGGPTTETPTAARLFNIAQTDPLSPPASAPDTPGVLELGVRFSQGDVPATTLPLQYVGQQGNGVTLIGLDRQPFLRGASFLAVYENTGAQGTAADPPVIPTDIALQVNTDLPAQQLGSILAAEVCNPWPKAVDAAAYRIALASDAGWVEFTIDGAAAGGTLIPAGQCATFYVSVPRTGSEAEWTAAETDWRTRVATASGAPAPRKVTAPPVLRDIATGATVTGTPPPVPFHALASSSVRPASVLLLTGSQTGAPTGYVVDRMTAQSAGAFPFTHSGSVDVPKPSAITPGQKWEGRIASAGSLRRRNDVPASGAGFPAYIIERPADNLADSYTGPLPSGWYSTWEIGNNPVAIEDLFGGGFAVGFSDLKTHIGELDAAPAAFPSVQLFVPNDPLRSPSELGMLCAFTHMYVHTSIAQLAEVDLVRAADPTRRGEGSWRTISEQLGEDAHLAYDTAQAPSTTNINPCLGVLDMTRFTLSPVPPPPAPAGLGVLGGNSGQINLPDALSVPLASRVFDCFEALDIPPGLAQGRVNVNTAPLRALRMLPWMSPWHEVRNNVNPGFFDGSLADAGGAGGFTALSRDRAFALGDYREAGFDGLLATVSRFSLTRGAADSVSREGQTHLSGLRSVGVRAGARPSPGLVASGEMALIAKWNTNASNTAAPGDVTGFGATGYQNFAEAGTVDPVGLVRRNTGMPVTVALNNGVVETDGILDIRPNSASNVGAGLKPLDPIDDAEERLTVFRPLANVATTRSDVFTAWFVIRGYDPRRIAAVEIPQSGNDDFRVRTALNQLTPTHESRWLAVFDRSNVKSPIDRPRLLMLTQLPVK